MLNNRALRWRPLRRVSFVRHGVLLRAQVIVVHVLYLSFVMDEVLHSRHFLVDLLLVMVHLSELLRLLKSRLHLCELGAAVKTLQISQKLSLLFQHYRNILKN